MFDGSKKFETRVKAPKLHITIHALAVAENLFHRPQRSLNHRITCL